MTTQSAERTSVQPLNYASEPSIHPWLFVPVLYLMQAIPNFLVTGTIGLAYKSLSVETVSIAKWTGLAALPWTFKMFWGPLVDLSFTKRKWTIAMQLALSISIGLTAIAMTANAYFGLSVFMLFVIATFSATHDIACDGLYLISLDRKRQAAFTGVMSTSSRLGRLFMTSAIVFIAGWLYTNWSLHQTSLSLPQTTLMLHQRIAWAMALGVASIVYAAGMVWNFFFLPRPAVDRPVADVLPGERKLIIIRTLIIIAFGVGLYYLIDALVRLTGYELFLHVHQVPLPAAWNLTIDAHTNQLRQLLLTVVICAIALPPLWITLRRLVVGTPMGEAFGTYLRQPGFNSILSFIIFYRFGESMILNMSGLFFLDKVINGGFGLTLQQVSVVSGVAQPIGLIIGGLSGGWFISRLGLRRAFWPLMICMHTPNLVYIWLAARHPPAQWAYAGSLIEAIGYGFGFTGYFVYLMQVAQRGKFTTSHYAIGTGLGALFITFATIFAGIVQQVFGYLGVFIAACIFTIPGTLTLLIVPMDNANPLPAVPSGAGH